MPNCVYKRHVSCLKTLLQRVVSRKIREQNERVHMKRRKYKTTNKRDTWPSSVSSKEHDPDKMLTTMAVAFSKTSRNTDMVQIQDISLSAMAQAISAEGKKKNLRTNGLSRHQMKRKSSLKWIRIYRRRVWRTQDWNIRCDTGQADTPLLQMALKQLRLQHWARGKTKSTTALSMTEA